MSTQRNSQYGSRLSRMIQIPTVSVRGQEDHSIFYEFRSLLLELFPNLFATCQVEDFDGSLVLRWKGKTDAPALMLMNHQDVVEATGQWRYPPFSGTIAQGKLWGRGTLDTKAGLWAMFQAAEELIQEGFTPDRDVWFVSTCTEETDGSHADRISSELYNRGLHFAMILDEGGMILEEPIGGAKGTFAMIGLGEKGSANLKFTARSQGGHASTPGSDTPLVRLGKFMSAVEKHKLFKVQISPTVSRMYQVLATTMKPPLKTFLGHPKLFTPLLKRVIPSVSDAAAAMLRTTLAFTMTQGSEGANVLPQEAWVIGNMRYSHHQGCESSIDAVRQLATKYNIETEVLDAGFPSPMTDLNSAGYQFAETAIRQIFPDVIPCPYLMMAASDSRFMSRISDCCLRFAPFRISQDQMKSVHGLDENIDLETLSPAVDFYKFFICHVDFS